LVVGALACGFIAGGAVYSAMICRSAELMRADHSRPGRTSLENWDWYVVCGFLKSELMNRAIVGWCFLSAYSVAYHLLMVMVSKFPGHKAGLTV